MIYKLTKKNSSYSKLNSFSGFTTIEILIGLLIFSFMMALIFMALSVGRSAWFNTDTQMQLRENLKRTVDKISRELRESGSDSSGSMKVSIADNSGINNTDIISFSVPVKCQSNSNIIDENGDVAYWGAPLYWGCNDSSCMDANNSCSVLEYKSIQYRLASNGNFLRRVLDGAGAMVREDILSLNIVNFQASLSADNSIVTISIVGSQNTVTGNPITSTTTFNVYLRNRG